MKKLLFVAICILASCSTVKVSYDYDKAVDFSKYKTYAYTEDAQKLPVDELDKGRIMTAVDAEMTKRGLTKSDNPDMLVDMVVKTEQKRETTATTSGSGMYRYGYGGGFSTTQINVNDYIEGTLAINLIDKTSEKIVWHGRGTKTLEETPTPTKKEQNIKYAVSQILKNYPATKK